MQSEFIAANLPAEQTWASYDLPPANESALAGVRIMTDQRRTD